MCRKEGSNVRKAGIGYAIQATENRRAFDVQHSDLAAGLR